MMVFTSPGKIGDCLLQWPVAFWWHRNTGKPFEFWMDERTCKPLVPLYEAQPGCAKVELRPGIESYQCGGQPWSFGLDPSEHDGRQIVHLGLRAFPKRQLTLEAFENAVVAVQYDPEELAETPSLVVPEPSLPANRLLLHGMAVCPHTGSTPGFWLFLASIREQLGTFDEVVWIGSERDREVGVVTYPAWGEFGDHGDFLALARYMAASRLVIACGSSMAALAGALKVPCVRVHDPIGQAPKVIWSNLGRNQLNCTELELRTAWPEFRDRIMEGAWQTG